MVRSLPADSKPILIPAKVEIGRRPKTEAAHTNGVNGHMNGVTNGVGGAAALGKRKREADEADLDSEEQQVKKRGRVPEEKTKVNGGGGDAAAGDNYIVLDGDEDAENGAITIDDD